MGGVARMSTSTSISCLRPTSTADLSQRSSPRQASMPLTFPTRMLRRRFTEKPTPRFSSHSKNECRRCSRGPATTLERSPRSIISGRELRPLRATRGSKVNSFDCGRSCAESRHGKSHLLARYASELDVARHRAAEAEAEAEAARHKAAEVAEVARAHAQEITDLRASASWRVTAPLRSIKRAVTCLLNGVLAWAKLRLRPHDRPRA